MGKSALPPSDGIDLSAQRLFSQKSLDFALLLSFLSFLLPRSDHREGALLGKKFLLCKNAGYHMNFFATREYIVTIAKIEKK